VAVSQPGALSTVSTVARLEGGLLENEGFTRGHSRDYSFQTDFGPSGSWRQSIRAAKLICQLGLAQRLKVNGAIPPLPHAFMLLYLIKHRDSFNFNSMYLTEVEVEVNLRPTVCLGVCQAPIWNLRPIFLSS
jgi:hypothetical protein